MIWNSRYTLPLFLALALTASTTAVAGAESFDEQMDKYLQKDENIQKVGDALQKYFMKKRQEQENAEAKNEQKQLEEQFKNPVKVDIGESPVRGNPNAKITIVEFSDFQCPFCSRGAATMDEVLKAYPNDVKVVFKNLPLPFHQDAKPAAIAALAAQRQGKFWEMHDLLFKNQGALKKDSFLLWAKDIGLDVPKFTKDLEDPALAKRVEEEAALGGKLGVNGTPGFFINGVNLSGARPLASFKEIIDRWLKQGK